MASTINSAPAANNASAMRTKGDGRRQSASPGEGGQRRTNSHKAWSQGTNPITQRSSHSNGNSAQRQSGSPRPSQKESNTPENHAHDRLVFLFASFIGLTTTVTTCAGDKFIGIFSAANLEANDSSVTLKMVQNASQESEPKANGVSEIRSPYLGSGLEHVMTFNMKDVANISVPNVVPAEVSAKESNGAASGFRTDTDISGNLAIRERTLQRWEPAETDVDMSLESTAGDSTGWDQFEANDRLFGLKTNYDENIYTTTIDRSDPSFRQKQADAARIAREIESSAVDNAHMREERGLVAPVTGDDDEEAKYSGVQRETKASPALASGQPNKYTPPARRQPGVPPIAPAKQPSPAPTSTPAVTKEAAPAEKQQASVPSVKTGTEIDPKSVPGSTAPTAVPKRAAPENATANVETEVLDHFRQFANNEKLKMQERRRNQASYDRTVKLNELMKFSKNFKLSTPVPKDLVPILAKDPHKQEAIISRTQETKSLSKSGDSTNEQKTPARSTPAPMNTVPPAAPAGQQNFPRGRPGYPPTGPLGGPNGRFPQQPVQPRVQNTGMLGHRLADNLQQRKTGATPAYPPTGPASEQSRITSPAKSQASASSATPKFNVRAMEFKPNPAASTFTPGGSSAAGTAVPAGPAASPRPFSRNRSISRALTPTSFFGARKPQPASERPSINDQFNPIKRMKKEITDEKLFASNGGIPPPYKTAPTWDAGEGNEEKTYDQMFKQPTGLPSVSPQGRSASNNPHMPQQHQLHGFQFPQGNPGMPPSSGPPTGPHIHHPHAPHVDDNHRMQLSQSNSGVFPSPRMQPSHMGYPSPMPGHAQLPFQQGMPQVYGGGMGAPMMMPNTSNGPYMGVPQAMTPYTPQMQMYSPSPGHAYPHAPPPQPQSGYPSPSRGAPMMMHQNSQSGQPPQMMFMAPGQGGYQQPAHLPPAAVATPQQQPHFSSSPHQTHHFPHNQHRNNGSNFNQMPQVPPPASSNAPATPGSGSHSAEATEEAK
ncbi:hypothetical protein N7470_007492 [Penicillium chermesinum]|nr:hypothetical protein N7470_007492 [Penicillium chermesinum]